MITHRNACMNFVGMLLHMPMRLADRYLWTLPMFHANGWTFTWTVTAVGRDARVPAESRRRRRCSRLRRDGTGDAAVRGADRADRARERARGRARRARREGVRVMTAGAPPAAVTIQRIEGRTRAGRSRRSTA